MSRSLAFLCFALPLSAQAAPTTCGEMKDLYKKSECCQDPDKKVQVCPYNFAKPSCALAEVQAPIDLSTGATGLKMPKMATLTKAQAELLPYANVHFHLGAEHKSDAYNDDTASKAYDAAHKDGRRLAASPRPGWMCPVTGLTAEQLKPYAFVNCMGDVTVGKTYEIHYVRSSAGYSEADLTAAGLTDKDLMNDGLGGAANGRGLLNPMVVVQGQVFQIVNDDNAPTVDDLLHGWLSKDVDHSNSVMYPGSTTGPSHNNEVCSPYAITWHVDKACHKVSAKSFDKMCGDMVSTYGLDKDRWPHGSRILVDAKWSAKPEYVVKYA